MRFRNLPAMLRELASAVPHAVDADLLGRFLANRDQTAFAQLVQRHGRLVWSVCRSNTRSDAEADDAFQATFLVLIRQAGKIRETGSLSAWLHRVAFNVCSRARWSAKRRSVRESATAIPERHGDGVPDSAWDRMLAAVHEEVARLPESLRVPFVLCCLEGKGQTEAAGQLGWKLGTLSGRLTRAKDAVLARLEARGMILGVALTVGLSAPPSSVTAKTVAMLQVGFAVPDTILQLSQGVIGMSLNHVKMLAAGVLVACGLMAGGGSHWMATVGAQGEPKKQPVDDPLKQFEEKRKKIWQSATESRGDVSMHLLEMNGLMQQLLDTLQKENESKTLNSAAKARIEFLYAAQANKDPAWEYDFEPVRELDRSGFVKRMQTRNAEGWEYNGQATIQDAGKPVPMWVFCRPMKIDPPPVLRRLANPVPPPVKPLQSMSKDAFPSTDPVPQSKPLPNYDPAPQQKPLPIVDPLIPPTRQHDQPPPKSKPDQAKQDNNVKEADLRNRIDETIKNDFEKREMRAKRFDHVDGITLFDLDQPVQKTPETGEGWVRFSQSDLLLPVITVSEILQKLGQKKFGREKIEIIVSGDKVYVLGGGAISQWARETVNTLNGK